MNLPHDLQESPLAFLAIAIVIVLLGWYLVGREIERQRSIGLSRAVAAVLRPIGSEGSFRWLGPGRCELRLDRTRRPFTGFRVIIWLRSRAILPVALLDLLRGRSDLVAFAADLSARPRIQFELVDRQSSVGQRALARTVQLGWRSVRLTWGGKDLDLAAPDVDVAQRFVREIGERDLPTGIDVLRLAVVERAPQLNLTVAHPESLLAAGRSFESWLRRIGESVASWAA